MTCKLAGGPTGVLHANVAVLLLICADAFQFHQRLPPALTTRIHTGIPSINLQPLKRINNHNFHLLAIDAGTESDRIDDGVDNALNLDNTVNGDKTEICEDEVGSILNSSSTFNVGQNENENETGGIDTAGNYPPTPSLRDCFKFALPALGIYACPPLMSLIDVSFIGRVSSIELAALGPAGSISDSSSLPLLFLSIAATNLVAKSHAMGDDAACARISRTTLVLGAIGGTILAVILYQIAGPLSFAYCGGANSATAVTKTAQILAPLCSKYVTIRALALPAVVVATIAQAVCIGIRDTRTPMISVALAGGLNFLGDLILVSGLGMGLAGAAWATTLSQFAAAGLLLRVLQKRGFLRRGGPTGAIHNSTDASKEKEMTTRSTVMQLLSFVPFLFVMGVKIGMHNSCAATAASLGGAPAAAHTALFAMAMLCFTFGDVGSSLSQAFLPAFATAAPAASTAPISTATSTSTIPAVTDPSLGMDKGATKRGTTNSNTSNIERISSSFDIAAAIPTIKQLLKCTFTISATVVCMASALLTMFSGQITNDPAVIRQMRATLPLMIATLSLHGTAVTLEGLLLARKNFRGLSLTYTGVALSVAVLLALVRHFHIGLVGVWGCYVWFQASRVVTFSIIGGLLSPPQWWKRRHDKTQES